MKKFVLSLLLIGAAVPLFGIHDNMPSLPQDAGATNVFAGLIRKALLLQTAGRRSGLCEEPTCLDKAKCEKGLQLCLDTTDEWREHLSDGWSMLDEVAIKKTTTATGPGCPRAQSVLGTLWSNYTKIEPQFPAKDAEFQAFLWFSRSSRQNHYRGTVELAQCYIDGRGCERNVDEARFILRGWLEKNNPELTSVEYGKISELLESIASAASSEAGDSGSDDGDPESPLLGRRSLGNDSKKTQLQFDATQVSLIKKETVELSLLTMTQKIETQENKRNSTCHEDCPNGVRCLVAQKAFQEGRLSEAFPVLLEHREGGCPNATLSFGLFIERHWEGVSDDEAKYTQEEAYEEALACYREAAEQLVPGGCYHTGRCLELGIGCKSAHDSSSSAGESGNCYRMFMAHLHNFIRRDGEEDEVILLERMRACPQPYINGFMAMARCYKYGWDVNKSKTKKRENLEHAFSLGHRAAAYLLGEHHFEKSTKFGRPSRKKAGDRKKALSYFLRYLEDKTLSGDVDPICAEETQAYLSKISPTLTSTLPPGDGYSSLDDGGSVSSVSPSSSVHGSVGEADDDPSVVIPEWGTTSDGYHLLDGDDDPTAV